MTSDSPEWGLPKHLTNKQTNEMNKDKFPPSFLFIPYSLAIYIFSHNLHIHSQFPYSIDFTSEYGNCK